MCIFAVKNKEQYKMSNKTIVDNLYKRSDKLIDDWLSNNFANTGTYKTDLFLSVQKKPNGGLLKPEYIDLMPEPFFGNPDDNLAVILNLNPGYGEKDKFYISKDKVKNVLSNGYSVFAKNNPYLTDCKFHPDAFKWWKLRLKWLCNLELCCMGNNSGKLPFVMEFCPWHSHNWGEANLDLSSPEIKDYIEKNVLLPAVYAVKQSVLGFVISIGKIYSDLYSCLGFIKEKEWSANSGITDWPISPRSGKPTDMHFEYYKKIIENQNIKVLSIWHSGSNYPPSNNFLLLEKEIIDYIRNN